MENATADANAPRWPQRDPGRTQKCATGTLDEAFRSQVTRVVDQLRATDERTLTDACEVR